MDGRGGCCIARYSSNGGRGEINYGMSKVHKIMLKFRPIAPKPVTSGSGSGSGSGSSSSTVENKGGSCRKRKYVRANGYKKKDNKKVKNTVSDCGETAVTVTLPLMPETPDRKENNKLQPMLLSFNNNQQTVDCYGHVVSVKDHKIPKKSEKVSFVTMECVTETWLNGDVLGFTDQARVMSLEMDTCPSFVTNCNDVVVRTNKAYRELTGGGETVVVKKCNRVTMPVTRSAFTCKMKVTWGMGSGSTPSSITAPCDVVRLRSGGFAWRLDVNAALCLGR